MVEIRINKQELINRLTDMLDLNYHGYESGRPKQNLCMRLKKETRKIMATSIADGLEPEFGKEV